ncbi:hypothetical protein HDU77_005972 [Chytriomyces hyalinus]|nr:hypothetical protein HDU77_005972 [Chytriomyces hyalinus]
MDLPATSSTTEHGFILATVFLEAVLACSVFVLFIGHLAFLWTVEGGSRSGSRGFKILIASPNILLSSSYVFLSSFFAVSSFSHYQYDSEEMQHTCMKAVSLSFALSEMSYLFYNFARSAEVLKLYSSPSVYAAFRYLLYMSPLFCSTAFFVELVPLSPRESYMFYIIAATIPASVTITLDTFLTYSFLCHIYNVKMMNAADPQNYISIAQYGLASNMSLGIALIAFVCQNIAYFISPVTFTVELQYYLSNGIFDFALFVAAFALLLMKISLLKPHWLPWSTKQVTSKDAIKVFFTEE